MKCINTSISYYVEAPVICLYVTVQVIPPLWETLPSLVICQEWSLIGADKWGRGNLVLSYSGEQQIKVCVSTRVSRQTVEAQTVLNCIHYSALTGRRGTAKLQPGIRLQRTRGTIVPGPGAQCWVLNWFCLVSWDPFLTHQRCGSCCGTLVCDCNGDIDDFYIF